MMPPWGFLTDQQLEALVDHLMGPETESPGAARSMVDADETPKEDGWQTYVDDEGSLTHPVPTYNAYWIQPFPGPRWLSGGTAAVGHLKRD